MEIVKNKNLDFLGFPNYEIHLFEDGYSKVYSLHRKKYMVGGSHQRGYHQVTLSHNRKVKCLRTHRIIGLAFIENPNLEVYNVINHKDGNTTNNHISNLEWSTVSLNTQHAYDNGLSTTGELHFSSKLTEKDVLEIKESLEKGDISYPKLALKYDIDLSVIYGIRDNKIWKSVGPKVNSKKDFRRKLSSEDKERIKSLIPTRSLASIGREYGVSAVSIRRIRDGEQ